MSDRLPHHSLPGRCARSWLHLLSMELCLSGSTALPSCLDFQA
jgi:hypothetical protein